MAISFWNMKRTVLLAAALWLVSITFAHLKLNTKVIEHWLNPKLAAEMKKSYRIGFLPVTCHLTCPTTHFINKEMTGKSLFEPVRFNGWPELKEAFLSDYTDMTFLLAPMVIKLREEGIPLKVVYCGHRDGAALMVHKDSGIFSMSGLKGKKVAVPNRYANHYLLIARCLKQEGMSWKDIELIEMPPPDMPAALSVKAVDAIISGEPFCGQPELDGYGRALWQVKDIWPGFISCVFAVKDSFTAEHGEVVQELVDGIAKSGKWIDSSHENRLQTANAVSKFYYNQHPRLLEYVLSKPPDRVTYSNLRLLQPNWEEIYALGVENGVFKGTLKFEDYADTRFSDKTDDATAWNFQWADWGKYKEESHDRVQAFP